MSKFKQIITPEKKELCAAYEQILKKANDQYLLLQHNQHAWQEIIEEREEWDPTLADGLEDDHSD